MVYVNGKIICRKLTKKNFSFSTYYFIIYTSKIGVIHKKIRLSLLTKKNHDIIMSNWRKRVYKMRIRFKPWARPELEASKFYIDNPEEYKGKWKELFQNNNPIHLELGCGKGGFISQLAVYNPDVNYIAIDFVDAMLGLAKRKIEEEYHMANREIDNISPRLSSYTVRNSSDHPVQNRSAP